MERQQNQKVKEKWRDELEWESRENSGEGKYAKVKKK